MLMPQEIQVWSVLPALRREFAKCLVKDLGLSQKQAAEFLEVTEPAISQYFKAKRAIELAFGKEVLEKIRNDCENIVKSQTKNRSKLVRDAIYNLSISKDVMEATCYLHKKQDSEVPEECNLCFKNGNQ